MLIAFTSFLSYSPKNLFSRYNNYPSRPVSKSIVGTSAYSRLEIRWSCLLAGADFRRFLCTRSRTTMAVIVCWSTLQNTCTVWLPYLVRREYTSFIVRDPSGHNAWVRSDRWLDLFLDSPELNSLTILVNTVVPSLTATSLQQPLFWADSPYIYSYLNLSTTTTVIKACPQLLK